MLPADSSAERRAPPSRRPRTLGSGLYDCACGTRVACADPVAGRRLRLRGGRVRLPSASRTIVSSPGPAPRRLRAMCRLVCIRACRRHRHTAGRRAARIAAARATMARARRIAHRRHRRPRARRRRASVEQRALDLCAAARRDRGMARGGGTFEANGSRMTEDAAASVGRGTRASRVLRALRYHAVIAW